MLFNKLKSYTCQLILSGIFLSMSVIFMACVRNKTDLKNSNNKPNVIFILVDDLGYHDLGFTGSVFYESPNIDKLAKEGMVFNNAYAASSVCSPSRAAIMSGKHPARLNLTDYIPGNRHWGPHSDQLLASKPFQLKLDLKELTIAEAFKEKGYKTMFAGKWHLGEEEIYYPEHQGFDINIAGNKTGHPSGGYFSPYNNPQITDGYEGEYLTDRITSEVIDFVEENKNNQFFAFLSYYTVHLPLQAKPEKVKKYKEKLLKMSFQDHDFDTKGKTFYKNHQNIPQYAAMVESMDENIGRLLDVLVKNGLEKNTIIIFTSDNGGMATSNRTDNIPTSNHPLRAGKGWLYEGGIKEPLIVRWPDKIKAGSKCTTPVIGTDFYPTLLDLSNIKLNPNQHQDGRSLKPLLFGDQIKQKPIFWHYPHYSGGLGGRPSGAIRLGDFKLIEFYEDMHVELYNIKTDISEKNNLGLSLPVKTSELLELLHQWRNDLDAQMPIVNTHYKE